jgi:hypothetical protein
VTLKTKIFRGLEKAIADGRLTEDEVKILRDHEERLQYLRPVLQELEARWREARRALPEALNQLQRDFDRERTEESRKAKADKFATREAKELAAVRAALKRKKPADTLQRALGIAPDVNRILGRELTPSTIRRRLRRLALEGANRKSGSPPSE